MNPPAKLSPGAGRVEDAQASGYAEAAKTSSPEKKSAPYSPRFTTTARGPKERIRRAALTTLCSSGELPRLGVVHEEQVDPLQRLEQALALRR